MAVEWKGALGVFRSVDFKVHSLHIVDHFHINLTAC